MSRTRQLAAIMFTDMVGYTSLMGSDEELALRLLRSNQQLHRQWIGKFHGKWLKEMGDGILASFPTVSDAVYCAAMLMEAVEQVEGLDLRIGIHLGEVVVDGQEIYGDGVNIASRLETVTPPGCIYISESVRKNILNKKGLETTLIGDVNLKNVKEPVRIFLVSATDPQLINEMSGKPRRLFGKRNTVLILIGVALLALLISWKFFNFSRADHSQASVEKALAVLPFKLIGSDEEGRFFAEGMMRVIINNLSSIEDLQVRSSTSVERYENSTESIGEIANSLRVNYIIEGSAQKYREDIRIMVQLIDPLIDDQIWEKTYDRKWDDIFQVQTEISNDIAKELGVVISGNAKAPYQQPSTRNEKAWEHFLKGQYYQYQYWKFREEINVDLALDFYRKALEEDPNFTEAMVYFTQALQNKHWVDLQENAALRDSIHTLYQRAIALNPRLDITYQFAGFFSLFNLRDTLEAYRNFTKAVVLNPDRQSNYGALGTYYLRCAWDGSKGHLYDSALFTFKTALEKEPDFSQMWIYQGIAESYLSLGALTMTQNVLQKALTLEPDRLDLLAILFHTYMLLKQYDKMHEIVQRSLKIRGYNKGLEDQGKV
ncbi:MAG: hypothetical protein OER04_18160, partial [Cyclobacteriaceae bacterium]|nr:hypothetical protein [Cyclobacteriaceae bacterium]